MAKKMISVVLFLLLSVLTVAGSLETGFKSPPRQAGIRCWWWWLNSNVTQESITNDLEAMHHKGFSGAMIFDAGTELWWGPDAPVPNGPMFSSPEWTELYMHALNEAKRLDLEIGLSIQSGWNLGGPTVTLDDKAKQITWSEIQVEGPAPIETLLPIPKSNYKYYRDICVLAYPKKEFETDVSLEISASSQQAGQPVENMTDGNGRTFWVSAGTAKGQGPTAQSPEWVQISLSKSVEVCGVRLEGRKGYGPKTVRIRRLGSTDHPEQTTDVLKLKDGVNRLSFAPMKGQNFRLMFEDAYDRGSPDAPRNVQIVNIVLLDKDGKSLGAKTVRKPIDHLTAKSGARELGGSAPDCRFLLDDHPAVEGEEDARLKDINILTKQLDADGTLKWNVPQGKWTILRIGYTPTKAHVATSSDNWKGHVLDYLSKDVFDRYWDQIVDPLLKKAGPMAGTVLKQLETDSWECGGMNWSPDFASDFKKQCGYDITPYLAVVAGKIIENRDVSNAFLADLRKAIAASISENHYRTFAARAAEYNMGIQPECSGPHAAPIDGITNYSHSDIVMSEFWVQCPHRFGPENRFFVKQASSAAHIYGKKLVGAEAFTTVRKPHWSDILWKEQKPAMDYEFCAGLNMIFLHTFTASPKEMGVPGQAYFAGTHINPQVTWWNLSDGFFDYMGRIQFVVQQGKFNADVLYYYGDHVPNIARLKGSDPAGAMPGYDYDVTNEDILLQLKVVDGKVVVPGGVHYRVLVLPDHKVLSYAALKQVDRLLKKGATVIGPKPERLVSLVGGKKAQIKFHQLADKLWGQPPSESGQKKVGKGRLVWGKTAREFLMSDGVAFDFEVLNAEKSSDYDYIHYTVDGAEVYFISNQTGKPQSIDGAFRVLGRQPQIWDPTTGQISTADVFTQASGLTTIPLRFDPYGSCFVVFRDEISVTKQGRGGSNYPVPHVIKEIEGPWQVAFDPVWGGPAAVEFKTLTDWTQHADKGIKYYSGEAVYANTFEFSEPIKEKRHWFRLNEVGDVGIASVKLNGMDLGITWTKPFRIEITEALKSGQNQLEITVVNNWLNRLIGDRGKRQSERFTMTNIKVRDDWNLQRSGLFGPVEVICD